MWPVNPHEFAYHVICAHGCHRGKRCDTFLAYDLELSAVAWKFWWFSSFTVFDLLVVFVLIQEIQNKSSAFYIVYILVTTSVQNFWSPCLFWELVFLCSCYQTLILSRNDWFRKADLQIYLCYFSFPSYSI